MSEGLESVDSIPNPFTNSEETEELADNTTESMTETEIYFDEEAGELKQREVNETEELEEQEEEKSEIEELRSTYENYRDAGSAWEKARDKARGNLVAALKEKNRELDDELSSTYTDSTKEELREEKQGVESEIEELRA